MLDLQSFLNNVVGNGQVFLNGLFVFNANLLVLEQILAN